MRGVIVGYDGVNDLKNYQDKKEATAVRRSPISTVRGLFFL